MPKRHLPAYLKSLSLNQQLAVELLSSKPGIKTTEAAKELNCTMETIRAYRRIPAFNEAVYNRYMDISGGKLVNVVAAMIREAERGNVQAANLVLRHYGKLEDKITIRHESPFEKFLKIGHVMEAEVVEVVETMTPEDLGGSFDVDVDLPNRDKVNDKLKTRVTNENKALKKVYSEDKVKRKETATTARKLRIRADKVGMEMLPPGRQRQNVRDEWIRELKNREKALNNGR